MLKEFSVHVQKPTRCVVCGHVLSLSRDLGGFVEIAEKFQSSWSDPIWRGPTDWGKGALRALCQRVEETGDDPQDLTVVWTGMAFKAMFVDDAAEQGYLFDL